jgi:hypothetical protein
MSALGQRFKSLNMSSLDEFVLQFSICLRACVLWRADHDGVGSGSYFQVIRHVVPPKVEFNSSWAILAPDHGRILELGATHPALRSNVEEPSLIRSKVDLCVDCKHETKKRDGVPTIALGDQSPRQTIYTKACAP